MPQYAEQIIDRELRISLYDNEAFASAEYRKRVQILRDGEPVGAPEWQNSTITQEALKGILGDAAVAHREHVSKVEAQIVQMRLDHASELVALRQQATEASMTAERKREDLIAEFSAALAERNATIQAQQEMLRQLSSRVAEFEQAAAVSSEPTP